MKLVLALVIALMLLAVMAPVTLAADAGTTVYISVSVDGKLLVAAQPVTTTDVSVDGALKAAHAAYYTGGLGGYAAGIDATFNMFLISKCWGVVATPFVIVNGAPLGGDQTKPLTADKYMLVANDNIIIATSTDAMNKPATPVALTATVSGSSATLTAVLWKLDFTTFTYSHSPLANAKVIDSKNASLGTTDAKGNATVTVPADGIVAIDGLAAINVKNLPSAAAPPATANPTVAEGTIPYTDAKNYIGKSATIEAQVFDKSDAGDFMVLYLGGPTTDPNVVGVEIKKADVAKFPTDLYVGKVIRITGELHSNPIGGASFSLSDPSQVQISTAAPTSAPPTSAPATPTADFPIFYGNTISLIVIGIIFLVPIAVVVITKMVRQSRLDKPAAASKK